MIYDFLPIARGPFKGMKFANTRLDGTVNYTKILGTYEAEISPFVYDAIASNPNLILNIGAGDGYYSAGFSYLFPNSKVISYEYQDSEIQMQKATLDANNITNCNLEKFCSINELLNLNIDQNTLIISDCEGYELELFTDQLFNKCNNFTAIIETHNFINPLITDTLISRFRNYGYLVYIVENINDNLKPALYNIDEIKHLPLIDKQFILRERPDGMHWIYCKKIR